MASQKEIKEHLKIALKEIGKIKPWFDKNFGAWIFSHKAYPVEYAGESPQEVIKNYPLYLKDFIAERLENNLDPLAEKAAKGRGGKREGAGRPKGSKKEETLRVSLPKDIALWIKSPVAMACVRKIMKSI